MGRNLIICCDGTANQFEKDRTNVLKLATTAEKDEGQLLYYHPGVGTMAPPGLFSSIGRKLAKLGGLAFGTGLKADVRDAYTYIMDHYRTGDQLYIFGFSRGAYTARAVCALLSRYGLLAPGNAALVPYALDLLWEVHRAKGKKKSECFRLAGEFKAALSIGPCKPHFLGVWDTVSSVGWIANPLKLPDTAKLPDVAIIRHAVSLDERRAFFRTNLVSSDPKRNIQEVWFPGDHCDVGGGHPEAESQLSKIALRWMIEEAATAGLRFDPGRVDAVLGRRSDYAKPDPTAPKHSQLWPFWWLAEFIPKKHYDRETGESHLRWSLFRRRTFSKAPIIDDSAWARGEKYREHFPPTAIKRSDYLKALAKRPSRVQAPAKIAPE